MPVSNTLVNASVATLSVALPPLLATATWPVLVTRTPSVVVRGD
jgi:hypothetical protein